MYKNIIKKIICLFLSIITFTVSTFTFSSNVIAETSTLSSGNIIFNISEGYGKQGETVDVPITVALDDGAVEFSLSLSVCDDLVIEDVKFSNSPYISNGVFTSNVNNKQISWASESGLSANASPGTKIADIVIRISESVDKGVEMPVTVTDAYAKNRDGKTLTPTVAPGKVVTTGEPIFNTTTTIITTEITDTTITTTATVPEEETCIFRTSVRGYTTNIDRYSEQDKSEFVYSIMAYNTGLIHIDVQCLYDQGYSRYAGNVGQIIFNYTEISPISDGVSKFHWLHHGYNTYVESYKNKFVTYDCMNTWSSSCTGEKLMSFDFYTIESYPRKNIAMNVFGQDIVIPFSGETQMEECLELGDIDSDGKIDIKDCQILLLYYTENLTGNDVGNLKDFVNKND